MVDVDHRHHLQPPGSPSQLLLVIQLDPPRRISPLAHLRSTHQLRTLDLAQYSGTRSLRLFILDCSNASKLSRVLIGSLRVFSGEGVSRTLGNKAVNMRCL